MNNLYKHSFLIVVLAVAMCSVFCGYMVLKNYTEINRVSINITDEDETERKEVAKESADHFLVSVEGNWSNTYMVSLLKEKITNDFSDYAYFISPETPPPNV